MRRATLLVLSLALGLWPQAARAASPPTIDVVKVDGSIDRTIAGYLTASLDQAESDGSTVVIQLDTAGTLNQSGVALARRIFEAKVPVIVWVGPEPAKAAGAGLLFMYASGLAAVAPGVGVGPLLPLDLARQSPVDLRALRQRIAGWARARGKPTELAFPEAPLDARQAIDGNIAQLAAISIPDLLARIDGLTVRTAQGEVTLATKIAKNPSESPVLVRFHDLGPLSRILHAVSSPSAIYVLLVLAFAAIAFELTQPGFGFAGFVGLVMLGLAIYGLFVVPAYWPGLGLLVAGVILLALDVVVRRLGVLTAVGLASFVAGSGLAFRDVTSAIDLSPWLIGSFAVATFLYYGFGLTVAVQSRERITSTQRGLVGLVGETRGTLSPEGPVFVKGTLWRGRSADGPIPPGTRVRVRGVDGLILRVEPEAGDE